MGRAINPAALREIRELVGISQRELGRRCGLHENSLTNIETGKHPVTPETQRKLASALGVPLDAITIPQPEPEAAPA